MAFPGVLNGGIIATLIDCHSVNTANAAVFRAEGKELEMDPLSGFVTGSLFVKYLRPTPAGETVTLRARVKKMKERKVTVTCSLYSGDTECAIGEVVAVRLSREKLSE